MHIHVKSMQNKANSQKTLKRMMREVEEMAVFSGKQRALMVSDEGVRFYGKPPYPPSLL